MATFVSGLETQCFTIHVLDFKRFFDKRNPKHLIIHVNRIAKVRCMAGFLFILKVFALLSFFKILENCHSD